jgi:hypothetical protein
LFSGSLVVLPPTLLPELKTAHEDVLSMMDWFDEENPSDILFMTPHAVGTNYHTGMLRKQVTAMLPQLIPSIHAQVASAFKKSINNCEGEIQEDGWKQLDPTALCLDVVARLTWSAILGGGDLGKLCIQRSIGKRLISSVVNDEAFMNDVLKHGEAVIIEALLLRTLPFWLRELVTALGFRAFRIDY